MSAALENEVRDRTIICGLHKVFPEKEIPKIGKVTSLSGEQLRTHMGLNALWYYTPTGEFRPTKHESIRLIDDAVAPGMQREADWYSDIYHYQDPPENVAGIAGIALAPWGEKGVFLQHFGEPGEKAPSYVDIPEHLQKMNFTLLSGVVSEMMDSDEPVYVGLNNSAGGLEEKDKGLMSVLRPHLQVVKFGDKYKKQSPEDIISARNEQGDTEVRNSLGDEIADQLEVIRLSMGQEIIDQLGHADLPAFWQAAESNADTMGATINFPGFTPQDLMRPEFRSFLKVVFHTVHHQLELLHKELFKSELRDVIDFVQDQRDRDELDIVQVKSDFNTFFDQHPETLYDSITVQNLRALDNAGKLRHPVGWALMMQFTKQGMFMVLTPSITNEAMGPVESLKYGLDRRMTNTQKEEMEDVLSSGRRVLRNAIRIREEQPLAA